MVQGSRKGLELMVQKILMTNSNNDQMFQISKNFQNKPCNSQKIDGACAPLSAPCLRWPSGFETKISYFVIPREFLFWHRYHWLKEMPYFAILTMQIATGVSLRASFELRFVPHAWGNFSHQKHVIFCHYASDFI